MTKKLVFVRHGQSEWNLANRFTGRVDVDLSEKGVEEAIEAGIKIKEAGIVFDHAHTSILKRAIKTCNYALEYSEQLFVGVEKTWRLNERHYGALQGLNKAETAEKYGDEQVLIWRRSYDTLPPELDPKQQEEQLNMRQFKNLPKDVIPKAENLKLTLERALPYYFDHIAPQLLKDETILVAAHGNSIRALVKHLEKISDEDIMNIEIPTGIPLVYELDDELNVIEKYYL